ncbi:MAG: HAMP domain-containing sensor histidine kinase [Polyangiaceae bacterium]
MLDQFLSANRNAIIARTQGWVGARTSPQPTTWEITHGIPLFLDELGDALRLAESSDVVDHAQILATATRHGEKGYGVGLTVGEVVRDYGDVCQAITELAIEQSADIPANEFRTLNLCLDDAIAGAVTEFSRKREGAIADQGTERLAIFAHEIGNLLTTALLAFESIKSGRVGPASSTAVILGRSLTGLRYLVDRSLADVRLDVGIENFETISVREFLEEVEIGAAIQAQARGIHFSVGPVDRSLTINGDRQTLAAAISNLLQNAFKFTHHYGYVSLTTRTTADRVLFEVEDECGGLPAGKPEDLFRPFVQGSSDRSGVGLGLAICQKAAKASGGALRVRDLPGKGCVFTLEVPATR